MKSQAKMILLRMLRARQRAWWNAPGLSREPLTAAEKKQVDAIWSCIWSKPSYRWHEHFKKTNGSFDPLFLPVDTFYLDLMPRLSHLSLAAAWEDKSYYEARFPDVPFPKLVAACVDGMLCDKELEPCSFERLWSEVERLGTVFVKPSMGSYQGIGAFKLNLSEADSPENLAKALSGSGDNYVIQELVSQHGAFASLNGSSVNIIRVNTVRLGGGLSIECDRTVRHPRPCDRHDLP